MKNLETYYLAIIANLFIGYWLLSIGFLLASALLSSLGATALVIGVVMIFKI